MKRWIAVAVVAIPLYFCGCGKREAPKLSTDEATKKPLEVDYITAKPKADKKKKNRGSGDGPTTQLPGANSK